ncbi:hypothetical protein [Mucilaginibacter rivuli]|nr:hypothetical protein [Mucilaginibacter rivuli]
MKKQDMRAHVFKLEKMSEKSIYIEGIFRDKNQTEGVHFFPHQNL